MVPTRAQVATLTQNLLGDFSAQKFVDGSPSAGQINIAFAIDSSYRDLISQFDMNQIPRVQRTFWYNLPAMSTQVTPAQMNIADFGEIVNLEERSISTTAVVSTTDTGTPITVTTASPHGFATGQEVFLSGVQGQVGANGRWYITVTGSTTFTLNNSVSVAAFTSSPAAVVTTSNDAYSLVVEQSELPLYLVPPTRLFTYVWQEDTFYFVGATTARQLKITFFSSGTAPVTGTMGVDNALEPLAYRAAALCAGATDMAIAGQLANDANVYLSNLVQEAVRAMQRNPIRPRAYRAGRFSRVPGYSPTVVSNP